MKMYESYCYPSINNVADLIRSKPFMYDGSIIQNVNVLDSDNISLTVDNGGDTRTFSITSPDCYKLGYASSYTGITTNDAIQLGSLVMIAFVSAYIFKLIKRAL